MVWRIEFLSSAEKQLAKLGRPIAQWLLALLDQRVRTAEDPRSIGEALTASELGAFWKYRVGDCRLICSIEDRRVLVTVVRIAYRSAAHRK